MFPGLPRHALGAVGGCPCGQGRLLGAGPGVQPVRGECSVGSGTAWGETNNRASKFQN